LCFFGVYERNHLSAGIRKIKIGNFERWSHVPTLFLTTILIKQVETNNICLDASTGRSNLEKPIKAIKCHGQGGNQARNL
jgi:hypothetical protein